MIKLVRVDHRLLHGQVAFSWTNGVSANCILVASDSVVNDPVWNTTLRLGKPEGVKLVIKSLNDSIESINVGKTDKYNLLIVVQSISDAKKLCDGCSQIRSINLGNTKESKTTTQISKQIFLEDVEKEMLKTLMENGIECEIRALADDNKTNVADVLK